MISAEDVAGYFLTLQQEDEGDLISHLKLQKLVYYAQGFCLALNNEPLFSDPVLKWEHGPVAPAVWHEYKKFGSAPIPRPENFDFSRLSDKDRTLLDEVYNVYGQYSAWRLRQLSHEPGGPWDTAEWQEEISHESMRSYFQRQVIPAAVTQSA